MSTSPEYMTKSDYLRAELNKDLIDLDVIREISFTGVPDEAGLRDVSWKVLLNYLPLERAKWPSVLKEKRQLYIDYMNFFIVRPGMKHRENQVASSVINNDPLCKSPEQCSVNENEETDHPLSVASNSQWQQYFQDNTDLLQQIDKDCRRLFPDYSFFQKPTPYPASSFCCTSANGEMGLRGLEERLEMGSGGGTVSYMTLRKRVEWGVFQEIKGSAKNGISTHDSPERLVESYSLGEEAEVHWEVVERILFIYAKLNKATGYVQGMNELLGPIYHVFATSKRREWAAWAEADAFFCFVSLMSENRDVYTKSLDNSADGIEGKFKQLNQVLKTLDWDLYISLHRQQIHPQFYAFRWLSLLFAQEFHLPDIERLWDTLFADPDRFFYSIVVAVAMLHTERNTILQGNFNHTMHTLQHYQHSLDGTLRQAYILHQKYISITNKQHPQQHHQNHNSTSNSADKDTSWSYSGEKECKESKLSLGYWQNKMHSAKASVSASLSSQSPSKSAPETQQQRPSFERTHINANPDSNTTT